MITMSYGIIPDKKAFDERFYIVTSDSVGLSFGNDPVFGNHIASNEEVWEAINERMGELTDEGADWVSCVLYVLGFEWI